MTQEQNILLNVIGSALTGREVTPPDSTCDWQKLVQEAKQQAVGLMFLDTLTPCQAQIPQETYQNMCSLGMAIAGSNMRVGFAQSQLVGWMGQNNWSYMILKGESAAAYYPKPELRTLGDVDFLIQPDQRQLIGQMLQEKGFTLSHQGHICHEVFRKRGAHLEMHFQVAGIPNGQAGELATEYLQDALACVQIKNIGSGEFCVPADRHHGLILLLHMQHHMLGEGIGLRHLCDWACFAEKTWQMDFWQESLLPLLKKIGLFTYASVMTKTASLYFGTVCPFWAQADTELCREVMEDILAGGNFGTKDDTRKASGQMVSNRGKDGTKHGKIYYLYKILHASTLEAYPSLKTKPLLVPFAMFWRACKYIWKVAKGERYALHKLAPKADERKSVYERLHIFEM